MPRHSRQHLSAIRAAGRGWANARTGNRTSIALRQRQIQHAPASRLRRSRQMLRRGFTVQPINYTTRVGWNGAQQVVAAGRRRRMYIPPEVGENIARYVR